MVTSLSRKVDLIHLQRQRFELKCYIAFVIDGGEMKSFHWYAAVSLVLAACNSGLRAAQLICTLPTRAPNRTR